MTPSKTKSQVKAATKSGNKKEKIFHPQSRKAGQISRANLRKEKMAEVAVKRGKRNATQADIYSFFFHAMPPDSEALTLPELHELIRDIWLARHEAALEEERAARRKGRPKSTKESKLEETKLLESEEYRTGMEVIDLTHPANVKLFRLWDQTEFPYIQLLRFIRISSTNLDKAFVSRPGKHVSLLPPKPKPVMQIDEDEVPELLPPPAAETDMTVDA